MRAEYLSYFSLAVLLTIILASCDRNKPTDSSTSGLASLVCDESFENILNQEVDVFEYRYPNANIIPYYASESDAVDSLLQMKTSMIIVPHELTAEQVEYLDSHKKRVKSQKIAVDAILVLRLALPRRVFTLSQVKYAVDRIAWLYGNRDLIGGLRFIEEPSSLRFFFGRLEPVSPWMERIEKAFRRDFGDSL